MRVSQAEMDKTHRRIVKGASRLLRRRGIENTSVNDVMKDAGLTHGGFYRHFESKEELVRASLDAAFDEAIKAIEDVQSTLGLKKGNQEYYDHYLSEGHVKHPEMGCPIAALGMDVARCDWSVKNSFAGGFNRAVERLSQSGNGSPEKNRAAAMRRISMLAGAVMIARATDVETARLVLAAARDANMKD